MTTPISMAFTEKGYFVAADSGTTTRFMKKYGDSVEDAGQDAMINQEADEPAAQEEDGGCAECNNEVK